MHNLSVKVPTPRDVFAESPRSYQCLQRWYCFNSVRIGFNSQTHTIKVILKVVAKILSGQWLLMFISEAMAEVAQISLLLLSSSLLLVASDPRGKRTFQVLPWCLLWKGGTEYVLIMNYCIWLESYAVKGNGGKPSQCIYCSISTSFTNRSNQTSGLVSNIIC